MIWSFSIEWPNYRQCSCHGCTYRFIGIWLMVECLLWVCVWFMLCFVIPCTLQSQEGTKSCMQSSYDLSRRRNFTLDRTITCRWVEKSIDLKLLSRQRATERHRFNLNQRAFKLATQYTPLPYLVFNRSTDVSPWCIMHGVMLITAACAPWLQSSHVCLLLKRHCDRFHETLGKIPSLLRTSNSF